jgi:hypothetical protein
MLSHSLGSTHTLHAEETHQEPDEVVSASPQQGENTIVPRDLEVHSIPRMRIVSGVMLRSTGVAWDLRHLPAVHSATL